MGNRFSRYVWFGVLLLTWAGIAAPKPAESIPVFANGQSVSCEQCHNAPPNLNAYGRYIMATNFSKVLDAHAQMRDNQKDPISLVVAETLEHSRSTLPKRSSASSSSLRRVSWPRRDYYASSPSLKTASPLKRSINFGGL